MSPSLLSDQTWAPTWVSATVRIEGIVELQPDRTDEALERLVTVMEQGRDRPWSLPEMGERYARLSRSVIGFTLTARNVKARFRFGQDERPEVWRELVANNSDPGVIAWMRRFGEPRD